MEIYEDKDDEDANVVSRRLPTHYHITQSLFQISIRKKLLKMFAEVFPRHVPRVNMIIKAGP